jgi:6-phosphogluconate dehydrogenase
MGTSLARNIAGKGFPISIYNRHIESQEFDVAIKARNYHPELYSALAFDDLFQFVNSLEKPRKIFLMVNAGKPVDEMIQALVPILEKGDLIIDGGNSHFEDTERRLAALKNSGVIYLGCGVSGGEEGALKGPAIMPGGTRDAYLLVESILTTIAAKNSRGEVCCDYIGDGGAGHFVKMVHNGIEYGEMQLIAEVYSLLRQQGKTLEEISSVFAEWNKNENQCYLLEITAEIIKVKDIDGQPLIDKILDSSGNKGTGSWTTIAACTLGVPVPTLTAALFARYSSSFLHLRENLHSKYPKNESQLPTPHIPELEQSLLFARIINHCQGLNLIREASMKYGWNINLKSLLKTWTGGCIIRSELIEKLRSIKPDSHENLLMAEEIAKLLNNSIYAFGKVATFMADSPLPYPCFSATNEYFKGISAVKTNASLIQAQRDYFGAHTFKRTDDPNGKSFHHNWQ